MMNRRVDLIRIAEKERERVLWELADPDSDINQEFGRDACIMWMSLINHCDIKWNNRLRNRAGQATVWNVNPFTGVQKRSEVHMSWPHFRIASGTVKEFKDTFLHELAHIMCPHQSHNALWKATAIAIGSSGKRCHNLPRLPSKRTERQKLEDRIHRLTEKVNSIAAQAKGK